MKRYICLLSSLFCLYSCSTNTVENEKVYVFDKNKVEELSAVQFPVASTIMLDSAISSTFPGNTNIMVDGDYIFCYTREFAHAFNKEGKYLNKIGNLGHGRGEYAQILDLTLNKKEKQVAIIDGGAVLMYDYNGEFLSKQKLESPFAAITYDDNDYWFASGNNSVCGDFELYKTDKEFKQYTTFIDRKFNIPIEEDNFGKGTILTYRNSFSHNIYHIKNGQASLAYQISIPDMEIPESLANDDMMKVAMAMGTESFTLIRTFVENDDYIYMLLHEQVAGSEGLSMAFYHWIINKKTSEQKILRYDASMANTFHYNPQVLKSDNNMLFVGYNDPTGTGEHETMCIYFVNLQQLFK